MNSVPPPPGISSHIICFPSLSSFPISVFYSPFPYTNIPQEHSPNFCQILFALIYSLIHRIFVY
ncbi:hypothetical protein BZA77DRAFT_120073 [Pyronema omphalodes]|nr:hypothetical protein BZA77DRAFT_120073 [Pyronema omphalodes]